jgi:hypothetical protein
MSNFTALRKKWANMANREHSKPQSIFLARALNAFDPGNMPEPLPFDVPDSNVLNSGMRNINAERTAAYAKFKQNPVPRVNAPKPRYNISYLISKNARGNNLTKNNRSKVRLQQLENYIKKSSNPNAIKSAKNQIIQLRSNNRRKTRKRN